MKYRSDEVRQAAQHRWREVCGRLGIDTGLLTPQHSTCPARGNCPGNDGASQDGGTRRFRYDDADGRGTWICSGTFAGDGLALVEHCLRIDWKEATERVGDVLGLRPTGRAHVECEAWIHERRAERRAAMPLPAPVRDDGRLQFDVNALRRFYRPEWGISRKWFQERSPVKRPQDVSSGEFLDAVFQPKERVLVFTNFRSQGDFLWQAGKGGFRLSQTPGVKAKPSPLPPGGTDGVWYLCQPVSGTWEGKSRRSQANVTGWPHLVLESDEAPEEEWLCFLARLALPVCAIYTSGGRSIHALVKVHCPTKEAWDANRRAWLPVLTKCGADGGALTAVRLTRLPGTMRATRKQELLYLDPTPDTEGVAIFQR